jgi:hypothetical protein
VRGLGMGPGEAGQNVFVVPEPGRPQVQGLAIGDDLAGHRLALFGNVAVHVAPGNAVIALQPVGQRLAFGLIARQMEGGVAQVGQLRRDRGCGLDGVGASLAEEGVGRVVQRVLAGGDEAVGEAFDVIGIDRRRRWFRGVRPLGRKVELGHRYAFNATHPPIRSGLIIYIRLSVL